MGTQGNIVHVLDGVSKGMGLGFDECAGIGVDTRPWSELLVSRGVAKKAKRQGGHTTAETG